MLATVDSRLRGNDGERSGNDRIESRNYRMESGNDVFVVKSYLTVI